MNVRLGFALVAGLALTAGACASGGGAGGSSGPVIVDGRVLEEGVRPRENANTREATNQLGRAQISMTEEDRRARYEAALEAARRGMEADPENPLSWIQAGEALMALGEYDEGDTVLRRAEELRPVYVVEIIPIREQAWIELFNAAIGSSGERDYDTAISLMEQANRIYKERPEAMFNLGNLYSVVGNTDGAIAVFQEAIATVANVPADTDPQLLEGWQENADAAEFNVAQLLLQADRKDEAVVAFQGLLAKNPGNVAVASNLGSLLNSLGRQAEAQAIFDALNARTDMTARDFLAAGIALFQSEDYAGAARSFERSLTLNPNSRDAAFNMSQAAYLAADGAEEGSELRTEMWTLLTTAGRALVQLDPKNENAFRLLAQGLIRTGAEQEAVALLEVMQALDFEVIDIQLQPIQGGGAVLRGAVSNRTLTSGSTVRLRISFSSPTGQIIGTQDVAVVVGGADSMTDFEVEFDQEVEVNGYKYEVIGG